MTSETRTSHQSRIRRILARFRHDADGAVTIDWVVLTAFTVMAGMGAAFYVAASVPDLADDVSEYLEETPVTPDG